MEHYKNEIVTNGFTIIKDVYNENAVTAILSTIETTTASSVNYRKQKDLFAIRQVFKEMPGLKEMIFSDPLLSVIQTLLGADFFLVKSIYFNKPPLSNWFVSYHQDLSIAVSKKEELAGYGQWTVKYGQYGVVPPVDILENIFTIRLHLDDCTEQNGALHVLPGSHKTGTKKPAKHSNEVICTVPKGGIMIMKPLLWHASHKSTIEKNRRVLHLEFSNRHLPVALQWAEKETIFQLHDAS